MTNKLSRTSPRFTESLRTLQSRIHKELGATLTNSQLQDVVALSMKGMDVKVERYGKKVIIKGLR